MLHDGDGEVLGQLFFCHFVGFVYIGGEVEACFLDEFFILWFAYKNNGHFLSHQGEVVGDIAWDGVACPKGVFKFEQVIGVLKPAREIWGLHDVWAG